MEVRKRRERRGNKKKKVGGVNKIKVHHMRKAPMAHAVILATREADTRRIKIQGQPEQII
jgi:hypothetical protein